MPRTTPGRLHPPKLHRGIVFEAGIAGPSKSKLQAWRRHRFLKPERRDPAQLVSGGRVQERRGVATPGRGGASAEAEVPHRLERDGAGTVSHLSALV